MDIWGLFFKPVFLIDRVSYLDVKPARVEAPCPVEMLDVTIC